MMLVMVVMDGDDACDGGDGDGDVRNVESLDHVNHCLPPRLVTDKQKQTNRQKHKGTVYLLLCCVVLCCHVLVYVCVYVWVKKKGKK